MTEIERIESVLKQWHNWKLTAIKNYRTLLKLMSSENILEIQPKISGVFGATLTIEKTSIIVM